MLNFIKKLLPDPEQLRRDLQQGDGGDLFRRRAIIGLSLFGMANMAAVTLLQNGMVKRLPELPLDSFDARKVNLSLTAYQFGAPDGTLGLASLALNLPLAAFGGSHRANEQSMVPILAAAKAALDAAAAGWFFYHMPAKEKAWCSYCIAGAATNFAILALAWPEARKALKLLKE